MILEASESTASEEKDFETDVQQVVKFKICAVMVGCNRMTSGMKDSATLHTTNV